MTNNFSLLLNDDNKHSLLEPLNPPYSNMTVKRAFIVWLHCGQLNEFKYVCNYFHYLEALEEELSLEDRVKSRLLEFDLLEGQPPTSLFLNCHFPNLYRPNQDYKVSLNSLNAINYDDCVFNLQGFHKLKLNKGMTTPEINKTSQMIRKYCKGHSTSLRGLLQQFHDFTKTCKLENTVNNISIYIKKKHLQDELAVHRNIPKNFTFLDAVDVPTVTQVETNKVEITKTDINEYSDFEAENDTNVIKNPNKIKILIDEARRDELMDLFPDATELPAQDFQNMKHSYQNFIASKIIEDHKKNPIDEFESVNNI